LLWRKLTKQFEVTHKGEYLLYCILQGYGFVMATVGSIANKPNQWTSLKLNLGTFFRYAVCEKGAKLRFF
jgi:hypothetical protein